MHNEIQQQTEEWFLLRKTKIGASDAPIIMEKSPWKTPYQLWVEKLSAVVVKKENEYMKRGIALEPTARQCFEKKTGIHIEPKVVFHNQYDWMMASLDGIDETKKIIVEIKCPGKVDHNIAKEGKIPEKYFPQLQHQMCVADVDSMYYFSFDGEDGIAINVKKNEEYIENLIHKEKKFYYCLSTFVAPDMCERDIIMNIDD